MAGGRIPCERLLALRLKQVAEDIGVRLNALASYLLREQNSALTEESCILLGPEFDSLSMSEMAFFIVPKNITYWVRDMSILYKVRLVTIVSIIIQDNLAALENTPEMYPWIASEMQRRKAGKPVMHTRVCTISEALYQRIEAYITAISVSSEKRITIPAYLEQALLDLPFDELIRGARKCSEKIAEEVVPSSSKRQKRVLHSIRIPLDVYENLKLVTERTGVSMNYMLEYIIDRDLKAAEEEVSLSTTALPLDLRERWLVLLRNILHVGEEEE